MSEQGTDVRWELYPYVAVTQHARAFIVRLHQFSRRPKTVDAYARNLDHFLASFTDASAKDAPAERWLEADEGVVFAYLDDLRHNRQQGMGARSRRALPDNVVPISGACLTEATIAQHVVTLRQFYDYLIRARLRHDSLNPLPRGGIGYIGGKPDRGSVRTRGRLPWIASAEVWERIVLHVVTQETARNRAMILVGYDGALRREELVRLCAKDYDRQRALAQSACRDLQVWS